MVWMRGNPQRPAEDAKAALLAVFDAEVEGEEGEEALDAPEDL